MFAKFKVEYLLGCPIYYGLGHVCSLSFHTYIVRRPLAAFACGTGCDGRVWRKPTYLAHRHDELQQTATRRSVVRSVGRSFGPLIHATIGHKVWQQRLQVMDKKSQICSCAVHNVDITQCCMNCCSVCRSAGHSVTVTDSGLIRIIPFHLLSSSSSSPSPSCQSSEITPNNLFKSHPLKCQPASHQLSASFFFIHFFLTIYPQIHIPTHSLPPWIVPFLHIASVRHPTRPSFTPTPQM